MRRFLTVLGALAVLAAFPVPAHADPRPAPNVAVILPTGDLVSMVDGSPIIERAASRQHVPFVTRSAGGRVSVAATDAPQSPAVFQAGAPAEARATRTAPIHEVTLVHLGFDGQPARFHNTSLLAGDMTEYFAYDPDGTETISVPAGRYVLSSAISPDDRADPRAAFLVQPVLDVTGDITVVLDARAGKLSSLSVPDAEVVEVLGSVGFTYRTDAGTAEIGVAGSWLDQLYTAQLGPATPVDGFASSVSAVWSTQNATRTYNIRYNRNGTMISGYQRAVRPAELTTVTMTYAAGNEQGMRGSWYAVSRLPGQDVHPAAVGLPVQLPSTVVRYFNNDGGAVQWRSRVYEVAESCFGCSVTTGAWTTYRPGTAVTEAWNRAVFSPSPGTVSRAGDVISVDLPMYSDGAAGRAGDSGDAGTTVLFRDGVEAGREEWGGIGTFTVPPAGARYRLEARSQRGSPYALSTSVTASWGFRSARTAQDRPLPLWGIRFAPRLDEHNTAPAGRDFVIPVVLTPAAGAQVGKLREVTVDVSYDDGATWTRAPYAAGVALVRHPAGGGFVSLRASLRDSDGNTASVTVLHAYRI
ncbi:hypothetical protein [Dactylosporangium sp. NPDC049140]|uniref:hypothetical protein n=1 Tax=Dactylosporangium sp. NPDC049140 TaxID=3155647 RepID=UPI0033E61523